MRYSEINFLYYHGLLWPQDMREKSLLITSITLLLAKPKFSCETLTDNNGIEWETMQGKGHKKGFRKDQGIKNKVGIVPLKKVSKEKNCSETTRHEREDT